MCYSRQIIGDARRRTLSRVTAFQRQPGGRPTLSTVAARAGVSPQTVSNALNNPTLLKPDTLARVLAVIDEVGYRPNRAARQLRTRASRLIGLRLEQRGGALIDRFLHTLVETLEETGLHVLLFTGDADDPLDGYDELLDATAVDAFVITDTHAGTPQADFLRSVGAPYVTFGRPWDDPAATHPWVDVDGFHGVALATRHLVDQGHSSLAFLGWPASPLGDDREAGWASVASGPSVAVADDVAAARDAAQDLLDDGVTGFACVSDTVAIGVLHAVASRGLVPGRDVGVTGFDDSLAASVVWPGLTSVRQPLEDVAREIVGLLGEVLAGRSVGSQGRLLRPGLVVRGSSLSS